MFIVSEPISWGLEHVPFNAALLKIIRLAYPEEEVHFYGQGEHSMHLREQLGDKMASTIRWYEMVLPGRHDSFFKRLSRDFRNVQFLLDKLNVEARLKVLVITGNPSLLWALKYYANTSHTDKKIQVILHGDFSKLKYRSSLKNHLNPVYHIGTLNTAMKIRGYRRLQHIVLEDTLRDAIIAVMPFLREFVEVLNHPVPIEITPDMKPIDKIPLQIGFVGCASERKGFIKYLSLASEIKKQLPDKVDFHVIGYILNYQRHLDMSFLVDKPTTDRLNRKDFVERLKRLHYVCLLYEKEYEFTASGVLLDCVSYGKPVIASNLPLFSSLQSKYGNIGYLCDNGSCKEVIKKIASNFDLNLYNEQVATMMRIRDSRTPEVLSQRYVNLINNIVDEKNVN